MDLNQSTKLQESQSIISNMSHNGKDMSSSQTGEALSSFQWMSKYGPKFMIRGEQVQIITDPGQFYQMLKVKTKKAKKRITFASLYLGTGNLEKDLVSCMGEACKMAASSNNSDFEVNILMDFTRGSRGKENSRTMLYPLMEEHQCVNVSLYHTPDLRGILKSLLPERFNETIGLTHIKLYLFDDSLIISGANLSHDYFTNRQDRYILFNDCGELADFFNKLIKSIMSFSFRLKADGNVTLHPEWAIHPYQGDYPTFTDAAREKIYNLLNQTNHIRNQDISTDMLEKSQTLKTTEISENLMPDTAVYPLVQMGPFGVTNDEQALLELLKSSRHQDNILLASGYFNLTDQCMKVIVEKSQAKFSVLMASPQANGFLGAKGIAGAIPYSYIYLAHRFLERVTSKKQLFRMNMIEYTRPNWTFHGKGLWYYLPHHELPTLTLVGSPNYGYRSYNKDLECEVAIVTENKGLQEQLRDEHVQMYGSSSPVTEETFQRKDRYVSLWIRAATSIIRRFF